MRHIKPTSFISRVMRPDIAPRNPPEIAINIKTKT